MKKKIIIWGIIIAVIVGLISFMSARRSKGDFTSVKTAQIAKGDIKAYLSTTGTIKSKNSKDYYSLQGKVKKVNVKVGDLVKQGDVLIEYDVQDPNLAVKQAQIQYENAQLAKQIQINSNNDVKAKMADLDNQISDLDKNIEEAKKNSLSTSALEAQRAQLKASRDALKVPFASEQLKQSDNSIALAKINLDNAKQNLSKSQDKIISDIDGVVTSLTAVEGVTGMGSQPAVAVQDIQNLKVLVSVGKYDANRIAVGQEAIIKNGNKEYKGKVSAVDPAAKKTVSAAGSDTTLGIEIDIVEKAEDLKIDFDTDVDILLGEVAGTIKVPAESIRTNKEDKTFVYTIEDGKAVEKEVKLGLQSDMEAQILEGVKEGDKVILNPSTNLTNGEPVKEDLGVVK
jgi:HlyD family secretion protein